MSLTPIWSLSAKRSELGHATKGQIYLSKIAIGAVVAALLWIVSFGSRDVVFIGSVAVFITQKVCWYTDTETMPSGWDTIPDWVCDGMLTFGWMFALHLWFHEWRSAAVMFVLWLATYPWSCE